MIHSNRIAQGVFLEDEAGVGHFLQRHVHWVPALNAFVRRATAILPAHTELSVGLYQDRESPLEEIVLWARHSDYPGNFHELIKRVRRLMRQDVDLRSLVQKGGKISLCTDFGCPRAP